MTNLSKIERKGIYGTIFILAVPFLLFYWEVLAGLWRLWSSDGDYSYAFIMPLVSAYMIWQKRRQITLVPLDTSCLGGAAFIILVCISLYGILGSSPSAVRPAMVLIILSIILFCFGKEMFRVLAFPLAMLLFMIPLPTIVQTKIGVPLKLIAAYLGVLMMRFFGMSVCLEGNVIDLGTIQLQVADACSGLRYILPLLTLGVLFAYFFEKVRWKMLVLVAVTIPIATISNGFRVGVTGILSQYCGTRVTEGFLHDFLGWLVFMTAFGLLYLTQFVLKVIPASSPGRHDKKPEHRFAGSGQPMRLLPIVICLMVLLLSSALVWRTSALPALPLKDGFNNFPLVIGGWQGISKPLDREAIGLSGAEEAFNAVYTDRGGRIVSLYIGYRGSPFNESENFFHSPNVCLPSTGWKVKQLSYRKVRGVAPLGDIALTEMSIDKMAERELVYFWFQTKSRTSGNVDVNRFHLSLHALKRDNTYDLFIRPITPLYPDESIQMAEHRMDEFIRGMMPVLIKYFGGSTARI